MTNITTIFIIIIGIIGVSVPVFTIINHAFKLHNKHLAKLYDYTMKDGKILGIIHYVWWTEVFPLMIGIYIFGKLLGVF